MTFGQGKRGNTVLELNLDFMFIRIFENDLCVAARKFITFSASGLNGSGGVMLKKYRSENTDSSPLQRLTITQGTASRFLQT